MVEPKSLQPRIASFFSEKMNVDVPSVEADLLETGIVDSLTFIELLHYIEQEFKVRISLDSLEIDDFRSIEKIAEFIASHNGSKGGINV